MESDSGVEVSAWIEIGASIDVEYDVFDDGQIELLVGGRGGFELVTTEQGLRNLLVHLEEVLRAARNVITRNDEGHPSNDLICTYPGSCPTPGPIRRRC